MSGQETSEEKTLPPSAKKLREARRKGQIAHSKEMVGATVTAVAFGYLIVRLAVLFRQLAEILQATPDLLAQPFTAASIAGMAALANTVLWTVGPFIGLLATVAVLGNVVINGGALAAVDPVLPKFERLDPIAGLKRLFGLKSLLELVKSVCKLAVIGGITAFTIAASLKVLVTLPACGLACAGVVIEGLFRPLLLAAIGVFLVVGIFDIGLQRWLFRREMRMTKSEEKRERKEMEGDPLIRNQHRQDRRRLNAIRTGLRNATFVIRNADMALAMRFAPPDAMVPILVARGIEEGALQLLDEAKILGLPVTFNPPAVAMLASRLKVGQIIAQDMFGSVIMCMKECNVL